jgi:hypothetical protein
MGNIDLIKGEFRGTIGRLIGTKYKGIAVIKSAPFGVAPPSPVQTASVRAFEKLNRLAAAMAKAFWPRLSLSEEKMLKHNAIAQWLKPLIASHQFQPLNFLNLIRPSNLLAMTTTENPDEDNNLLLTFTSSNWDFFSADAYINAITLDDNGYCGGAVSMPIASRATYIQAPQNPQGKISILAFASDKIGKTCQTYCGNAAQLLIVQGIKSLYDTKTGKTNKTISPNYEAIIAGTAIKIEGTSTSVGFYFEDMGGDSIRIRPEYLLENSRDKIRLKVPNLQRGDYYIYIKTQYTLDGTTSPDIKTLRLDIELLVV